MVGHKLMLVELCRLDPNSRDGLVTRRPRVLVAVDTVSGREGEGGAYHARSSSGPTA